MTRAEVVRASAVERAAARRRLLPTTRQGGIAITRDLQRLTADPTGRDATQVAAYAKMARFVAGRLQEQGVLPAGGGSHGLERYLQGFAWEQQYQSGRAVSENVVGIRRGDGTTNEAVLVIAHLDGLTAAEKRWYESGAAGRERRAMQGYQGANDNASAVAAALYISDAVSRLERTRGKPLKRDVIFLFPSAEEEGLKGAEAFARFSRQFGQKKIVGVVNFEMVGQGDPTRVQLYGGETAAAAAANPLYARGLGLHTRGNIARVVPGLEGDRGEGWFTRSDHYVFAKGGVPSVMYLGQPGAYHTPDDNLAAINPQTNLAVARHALRLVVDRANDARPANAGRALPIRTSTGYSGQVYPAPSTR